MQAFIDLSEGADPPVPTKVLAILFLNEKQLYAVTMWDCPAFVDTLKL
jgi:hypothetical protein